MLFDDFIDVFHLDVSIPNPLWIHDYDRALMVLEVAAHPGGPDVGDVAVL
jgi:hypothetical protein